MTFRRYDIEATCEQDAYDICERRAREAGHRVLMRDHALPLDRHPGRVRRWDVSLTVANR